MPVEFNLVKQEPNTNARAGLLKTDHGEIETPVFMPVGTCGSVKSINQDQLLHIIKAEIILGNTYHLYLRPGLEIIQGAKGLHNFIHWPKPMLTDSGGFQIFSLKELRKHNEEGVIFKSIYDGSYHLFTPEIAIDIQRKIGADIIMAFDECLEYNNDKLATANSMNLTHKWLRRSMSQFNQSKPFYNYQQTIVPIVQGGFFEELRQESCAIATSFTPQIIAIGGLSVGEPEDTLYHFTRFCCNNLPQKSARYLMGVGTPANLLNCLELGIDMFDCVLPTRNGRNAMIFTRNGIINIKNAKWAKDYSPIDPLCDNQFGLNYSKAYLRHLFQVKELLAFQIASAINLCFYRSLMKEARANIITGSFLDWKKNILNSVTNKL